MLSPSAQDSKATGVGPRGLGSWDADALEMVSRGSREKAACAQGLAGSRLEGAGGRAVLQTAAGRERLTGCGAC